MEQPASLTAAKRPLVKSSTVAHEVSVAGLNARRHGEGWVPTRAKAVDGADGVQQRGTEAQRWGGGLDKLRCERTYTEPKCNRLNYFFKI